MLTRINELPADHPIVGVHVVPFTPDGLIVMGWNRKDCLLETSGTPPGLQPSAWSCRGLKPAGG